MDTPSKKAIAYLETHQTDLEFIFNKIKKLDELNARLAPYLDPCVRHDCRVANVVDKCLVLIAESGATATHLHFMGDDLVKKIKHDPLFNTIKTIQCKVRPPLSLPRLNKVYCVPKMPPLSRASADSVRKAAEGIGDPVLQAIMRRIAERVR